MKTKLIIEIEKLKIPPITKAEQKNIESILNKRTESDKEITRIEKIELEISEPE